MVIHSIELCAGVGMLGEGAAAAFEFLGYEHRTVCYVEREAAAAAQLVTLMEAGIIDPAPVWSDILTFDGGEFSGKVDFVIAGFPCQDLSVAGARKGLDGERSGLFFRVLDIADDCGAPGLILENVAGIASATASVVDPKEGELEERAASRVVGELADRGWNAEWITLSASDVGASHGRARWFCLAWRVADPKSNGISSGQGWRRSNGAGTESPGSPADIVGGIQILGNTNRARRETSGAGFKEHPGQQPKPGRGDVAITARNGRSEGRAKPAGQQGRFDAAERGGAVADSGRGDARRIEPKQFRGGSDAPEYREGCTAMADTSSQGPQNRTGAGSDLETLQPACGADTIGIYPALPIFAPGPEDPAWREILDARGIGAWRRVVTDDEAGSCPWAPATKPGVRMLANGLALVVDESRSHQLRQIGNGVVPLCAATALVELFRRRKLT